MSCARQLEKFGYMIHNSRNVLACLQSAIYQIEIKNHEKVNRLPFKKFVLFGILPERILRFRNILNFSMITLRCSSLSSEILIVKMKIQTSVRVSLCYQISIITGICSELVKSYFSIFSEPERLSKIHLELYLRESGQVH